MNYKRKPSKYGKDEPEKSNTMADYNIAFPWIQLRQEDGRLSEPQRTNLVLKKLNMSVDTLILLAAPKADDMENGPKYPICRIGNRQAERAAELERLAMKRNTPKIVSKELEINWAIAPHDLRTRMTQLKNFLTKGHQVRVTLRHPKLRRKKRASVDQAKVILREVESAAAEVPGAKETKPREGDVGEMLVLLLQAPLKAVRASTEAASASVSDPTATEETPVGKETPIVEETILNSVAEEPGSMKE
jgi:translation initiation factor IF-3